jgi:hypothetical protein
MFQAKLFSHLSAGKRRAALLQTRLGKITVFEVFDIPLDEFAGIVGLGPRRAPSQFGQPPFDVRA